MVTISADALASISTVLASGEYLIALLIRLINDIVNLFVGAECIVELEGGKSWRARSGWGRMAIIPLASPSLPRSTPGSDLVKWHGIPRHSSGDVAAGNALKWDQRQKENVVLVRADA